MDDCLQKYYVFNSNAGFWQREDKSIFKYSDGDDVENALLHAVESVSDKSVMSEELFQYQKDWPSYYHFSAMRANLLRPFVGNLLNGAKVLELGCGCGAITRFLAETCVNVCAVEGSSKRAAIAAARCSGLPNIQVIADNIHNLPKEIGKFDVVTLIGVLEYAGLFDSDDSPALTLLRKARNFLKEDGCLILAIENKMGLKYFAGIPEEHLNIAWGGIAGAYRKHDVKTFSRKELTNLLTEAGFSAYEQFLPVPDYKLPTGVLTPRGLSYQSDAWDIAALLQGRRPYEPSPVFNLAAAWRSVVDAGLLQDMANSLCFIAHTKKSDGTQIFENDVLMYHYGQTLRNCKEFSKCVMFKQDSGHIHVHRRLLYNKAQSADAPYKFVQKDEPYFSGTELLVKVRSATSRPGWTSADLADALFPWINELKKHLGEDGTLPSNFLDAAPFNALIASDGTLKFYDLEWVAKEPVPFLPVVINHLYITFDRIGGVNYPDPTTPLAYPDLALALLRAWGFSLSMHEIKSSWENTETLWTWALKMSPKWETIRGCTLLVTPSSSYGHLCEEWVMPPRQCLGVRLYTRIKHKFTKALGKAFHMLSIICSK